MTKVILIVIAIAVLSGGSLWWQHQQPQKQEQNNSAVQSQPITQSPPEDQLVTVHRGDGFQFNYPKGWYISPMYENPSSTTLPLVVTKYPTRDYASIIISEKPGATFDDVRRELQGTVAQPLVEGVVDGEPSLHTLESLTKPLNEVPADESTTQI